MLKKFRYWKLLRCSRFSAYEKIGKNCQEHTATVTLTSRPRFPRAECMRRSLAPSKRSALSTAPSPPDQSNSSANRQLQHEQPTVPSTLPSTFKRQKIGLPTRIPSDQNSSDTSSHEQKFFTVVWRKQSMKKVIALYSATFLHSATGNTELHVDMSNFLSLPLHFNLQHKVF